MACEISEEFDTPVLYRTTTRVCHSKGLVEFGERTEHVAPRTSATSASSSAPPRTPT